MYMKDTEDGYRASFFLEPSNFLQRLSAKFVADPCVTKRQGNQLLAQIKSPVASGLWYNDWVAP